jgi:hypothetical protein
MIMWVLEFGTGLIPYKTFCMNENWKACVDELESYPEVAKIRAYLDLYIPMDKDDNGYITQEGLDFLKGE